MYTTRDWKAWLDVMPPGEPTLQVQGIVEVPTPGHKAKLVRLADGDSGGGLVLKVEVESSGGPHPQVVVPRDVKYQDSGSSVKSVEKVQVRLPNPNEESILLPVRRVGQSSLSEEDVNRIAKSIESRLNMPEEVSKAVISELQKQNLGDEIPPIPGPIDPGEIWEVINPEEIWDIVQSSYNMLTEMAGDIGKQLTTLSSNLIDRQDSIITDVDELLKDIKDFIEIIQTALSDVSGDKPEEIKRLEEMLANLRKEVSNLEDTIPDDGLVVPFPVYTFLPIDAIKGHMRTLVKTDNEVDLYRGLFTVNNLIALLEETSRFSKIGVDPAGMVGGSAGVQAAGEAQLKAPDLVDIFIAPYMAALKIIRNYINFRIDTFQRVINLKIDVGEEKSRSVVPEGKTVDVHATVKRGDLPVILAEGTIVQFAILGAGKGRLLPPTVVETDKEGRATVTYEAPTNIESEQTVEISASAAGELASKTITIRPPGRLLVEVSAEPNSIPSGSENTSTITADVTRDGAPERGVTVQFTAEKGSITDAKKESGEEGKAETTYKAPAEIDPGKSKIEDPITATADDTEDGEITESTTITVTKGELEVAVSADPEQIPGGGTSTITAAVTRRGGEPMEGIEVQFFASNGFIPDAATTDNNGKAEVTYEAPTIDGEPRTITVTIEAAADKAMASTEVEVLLGFEGPLTSE